MTDNEIWLKIAELKGWRVYDVNLDYRVEKYMGTSPEGVFYAVLPDWPTDIAAAWELVEEMPYFRLARLFRLSPQGWQCQSAFCGCHWDHVIDGENQDGTPYHCGCIYADADTAARAICLAWLKWKGVEV